MFLTNSLVLSCTLYNSYVKKKRTGSGQNCFIKKMNVLTIAQVRISCIVLISVLRQ